MLQKTAEIVERVYKIKFDEPGPDALNPYNFQLLMESNLDIPVEVEELTDKKEYSKSWDIDMTETGNKGDPPGTYVGVDWNSIGKKEKREYKEWFETELKRRLKQSEKNKTYLNLDLETAEKLYNFYIENKEDVLDIFISKDAEEILLNLGDWAENDKYVDIVQSIVPSKNVDYENELGKNFWSRNIKDVYNILKYGQPKDCPFCDSSNVILKGGRGEFDQVICQDCGASGPQYDGHPEDALMGWNSISKTSSIIKKVSRIKIFDRQRIDKLVKFIYNVDYSNLKKIDAVYELINLCNDISGKNAYTVGEALRNINYKP